MVLSLRHWARANSYYQCFTSATSGCKFRLRCFHFCPHPAQASSSAAVSILIWNDRRWAKRIHLEQVDVESAVRERDNNPNATLVHAYVELLEQYGDSDAQYWSSRLLAKRLTEEDSGDNNEEEAVPALAQGASNGKSAEPDRLRRPYRGDESDEENLYSFVPDTKRIKIESADNTSPSSNPTPPPMSIRQSSYRSPFEATPAEQDNNNVKVEVVK